MTEYVISYVKYLKKLEKIFSKKIVPPLLSLKDASLLIFEFQLRCFFSERTVTPPLQIDEIEQFLSKRNIQFLLEGREITPPLKEKDRIALSSPILSFFEDLGLAQLLLPKEMARFSTLKETPYICRCPDSKSPMCLSMAKVEQTKDLSPPMEQDFSFKLAEETFSSSAPPTLNS